MVTIQIFKEKGELKFAEVEYLLASQEVQWEDDYQPGEKIMFGIFHAADCPALEDKKCKCKPIGCVFQESKRAEVEAYWSNGGKTKTGELMKMFVSAMAEPDEPGQSAEVKKA